MKNFAVFLGIATVLLLAHNGYAAVCQTHGQMLSNAEQFQRAAENFNLIVNPGFTGRGPSYSAVVNSAPELVRKATELQNMVNEGATCENIAGQFESLARSVSFLHRSLQDTQYQFGNSAIAWSWRDVEKAYAGLSNSVQ